MKIEPGVSVGPLAIGMHRNEYESLIGRPERVLKRTPDADDWIAAYGRRWDLRVDAKRKILSITVFRPEKVELENIQLLGRDLESVEADLARSSFEFSRVDAGLWSAAAGVLLIEYNGLIDGVEVMAIN
jgi:hypothetical protein